ncbi:MAG: hypothetical protein GEV12_04760 [Micromonosporaceae bacterium]|nr:hypothetical protein [Micromonosporaceae bacterium]
MTAPPEDGGDEPEVAETGLGWPDERPQPPPVDRPGAGRAPVDPADPRQAPSGPAGPGPAADPRRDAAIRRLRQQAESDRTGSGSGSGGPSGAGVPPLGSAPRPPRPPGPPVARPRVPEPIVADRPGTVTAAAVILFIGAGLGVLSCCGVNYLAGQADLSSAEQNLVLVLGAILLGSALLTGVLGYYILQGRQWARVTTIVLCVIGVIVSVVNQFASFGDAEASGPLSTCLGVILNLVVIGLLSGQQASHYFRFANA